MQRCVVFADSDAKVSVVVKRFWEAEIVGGAAQKHAQAKKGTYFRVDLSSTDKSFLTEKEILFFGDEPTTVGLL